jgi:D-alanyl-D-alanine carboxypeptidase
MNSQQTKSLIEESFRRKVRKDKHIHNAYLLVHSERLGIDLKIAEGSTGSMPAHPNQPYYVASISKLFTSVLFGILAQKQMVSFEDLISAYVDSDLLHNLHTYKGINYTNDIKIKHLLNHTSGLNDFMEDTPIQGKSMIDLIFDEPSRSWTPQSVIQWSKESLKSHFPPGRGFHYSDTGYHLLGLIVENITEMPYHEALRQYIFEPCGMVHSSFAHYSKPMETSEYPLARLYGRNIDITHYRSLSIMFAGGGVISTTTDMLKFMQALAHHQILKKETFEKMKDWAKFFVGIDYGYGLMNVKTVPIIMPKKYNVWGNAGSTGTFMFYHQATDTYLIGGLHHMQYSRKGLMLMFKIIDKLVKSDTL